MQLVERHVIKSNHPHYQEIDQLCFAAKNLYNFANYHIRQAFLNEKKYLNYNTIDKQLDSSEPYRALPAKVSQQVLLSLHRAWLSFFATNNAYLENSQAFLGRPKLPKYKQKEKGRYFLVYTAQAVSKTLLKKGFISLSKTGVKIPTFVESGTLCQVRIVPKLNYYVIEVIYEKQETLLNFEPNLIAAIDIGVDNLAAVTSNKVGFVPLLVNGRPLKSINQYYNQRSSKLKSQLKGSQHTSKRIQQLSKKRSFQVDDYLHKASRLIINHLIANQIGTLVIGQNPFWKQQVLMGKRNNQNFVFIPHARFVELLSYKARLVGIKTIIHEESYTSLADFLKFDPIPVYVQAHCKLVTFSGKRIQRGVYRSGTGVLIHADVNASFNILRKVIPTAFSQGIEGVVVRPVSVTPDKQAA
ncbi:transposase [Brasilonema octagenarum UFV-E1]|uniref:Transposase n=1 Tax=Brasilonema sennae CENA114 TaxID=415709 RepID=A0A856MHY8_9CYAN|nr:RNA-guided endonuclease TnpB family protein [Brasilonema sennae]QDL08747.1 transposase [Brasilonema sennae CENA114]QDL15105.1 transposase [Brasilonema octagenarum UFV-E1]